MAPEPNVQQLPRGRHRLSREEVLSSQRGRMLEAIALAVAERGYAQTPVAEVLRRAGVSRETFYEHFANKEECFLAALDAGVEAMLRTMGGALTEGENDPVARFDRALGAYLRTLAAEPAFARTFFVEVYAAGPRALERRVRVQERFVETVAGLVGARTATERFACEALVAAVSSMVTMRVADGRQAELPRLRKPIIELVRAGRLGVRMDAAGR